MSDSKIQSIYRDGEPLDYYTSILRNVSGGVYVKEDLFEEGDRVTVVTEKNENSVEGYRESFFLSTLNERLYKDIAIEAEIEFKNEESQWVEFLARGVSIWDSSYTIDECYIFGYKNGDFYFAKRGYHAEGDLSYPYKQVFDLTEPEDDTNKFFVTLSEEKQNYLQLKSYKLDVNQRYIFRCELVGDRASFWIKNVSKRNIVGQNYEWVKLYESVTIRQNVNSTSNRSVSLKESVNVFEPFTTIQEEGFFGISVPNSELRMYRFEVENKQPYVGDKLLDDKEFSKKVATQFSMDLNKFEENKFNNVVLGQEVGDKYIEILEHEGDTVSLDKPISQHDISSIQLNDVEVDKDEIFEGNFLEINNISGRPNNTRIECYVDKEDKKHLKQDEKYFDLEFESDGLNDEYELPSVVYDFVGKYPNSFIGDILVEVEEEVISNELNTVGLQPNFDNFVDNDELNFRYANKKLFMETQIRGVTEVIELGTIRNNNYLFAIDDVYTQPNRSYEGIWKYNLANFNNDLLQNFQDFVSSAVVLISGNYEPTQSFGNVQRALNEPFDLDGVLEYIDIIDGFNSLRERYGISFGEVTAELSPEVAEYIETNAEFFYDDFNFSDSDMDPLLREEILSGTNRNAILYYIHFVRNFNFDTIRTLVRNSISKEIDLFEASLAEYAGAFNDYRYDAYSEFRNIWLRDLGFNTLLSSDGIQYRKFFVSARNEEFFIEDGKLKFREIPRPGLAMKVRIFYDLGFLVSSSYDDTVIDYEVPKEIAQLVKATNSEKGIGKFVSFLDEDNINVVSSNGVVFVIAPKEINRNGDQLFLQFENRFPYLSPTDRVKRYGKAPLKKVKDLLVRDFESSKEGYMFDQDDPKASGNWGRTKDIYDDRTEVKSGYWNEIFDGDFIKIHKDSIFRTQSSICDGITGSGNVSISGANFFGVENFCCYKNDGNIYYSYPEPRLYPLDDGIEYNKYTNSVVYSISGQMDERDFARHFSAQEIVAGVEQSTNLRYRDDILGFDVELGRNVPVVDRENGFTNSFTPYVVPFSEDVELVMQNPTNYLPRTELVDKYLDVSSWYEYNDTKLGSFYTNVIRQIIDIKSANRYYEDRKDVDPEAPLNLNNWFDGFYSGDRSPFVDLFDKEIYQYNFDDDGNIKRETDMDQYKYIHHSTYLSGEVIGGPTSSVHPHFKVNRLFLEESEDLDTVFDDEQNTGSVSDEDHFYIDLSQNARFNIVKYERLGLGHFKLWGAPRADSIHYPLVSLPTDPAISGSIYLLNGEPDPVQEVSLHDSVSLDVDANTEGISGYNSGVIVSPNFVHIMNTNDTNGLVFAPGKTFQLDYDLNTLKYVKDFQVNVGNIYEFPEFNIEYHNRYGWKRIINYNDFVYDSNGLSNVYSLYDYHSIDRIRINVDTTSLIEPASLLFVDFKGYETGRDETYLETTYGNAFGGFSDTSFTELISGNFEDGSEGISFGDFNVRFLKFTRINNNAVGIGNIKFFDKPIDVSKAVVDDVHFGRYYGNPWGTETNREKMLSQLKNTLEDKYDDFELYYVDMANIYSGDKFEESGVENRAWDTASHPISAGYKLGSSEEMGISGSNVNTIRFIDNPYVDPALAGYEFAKDNIVNGTVIFDKDDFSGFTDVEANYSQKNYLAIPIERNEVIGDGIFRELKTGFDIFWAYNASFKLKREVQDLLPIGADIAVEYEYTMNYVSENRNVPRRISQKLSLGKINGEPEQKFRNPLFIDDYENIDYFQVNRFWIDEIEVSDFSISQVSNDVYAITMELPDMLKRKKQVAYRYDQTNYYDLKERNSITDRFVRGQAVPWFWEPYLKQGFGYIKRNIAFAGFVQDPFKFENEAVFHLDATMDVETVKTSDVVLGGAILNPIKYGREEQDVIQVNTLSRRNNFVTTFDFIYDDDIENELRRFEYIFKGKFQKVNGVQQFTDFYSVVFGVDKGITFYSRKVDEFGDMTQDVLAQIQDIGTVLKRGIFYTVKIEVIRDLVKLYFFQRGTEQTFYFSMHLKEGHESSSVELLAEKVFDGLNIEYNEPKYFIDGDMMALKAMSPKVNFSNFKVEFLDAGNKTLGNPFEVVNYDSTVEYLKNKFQIEGDVEDIQKTDTGYEYVQIGNNILSRRNGSEFSLHNGYVEKFEVVKGYCFVQEKINKKTPMTYVNVYEKGFKHVQSIIVNGKQLINEPIHAFLSETNRKITNVEKVDGKLFLTMELITDIPDDWSDMTRDWEEYYAPWNLY